MNYFGRIVSGIKGYYSEINSATLTGAIDVIVVRQGDGSFIGSPFHVRFGKIGVLRSREKVVDISINDEPVEGLRMKLGEAGEAFFVEPCEDDVPPYLCTSPIPNMESLMSEGLKKLKQEIKESEDQHSCDSQAESSNGVCSRSIIEILKEDSDNDSLGDNDILINEDNETNLEITDGATFVKRSANISVPGKWDNPSYTNQNYNASSHQHLNEYYPLSDLDSPFTSPHQQSPANTQPPSPQRYLSDTEINYQCEPADGNENSGSNEMTWNWGSLPQGIDAKPSTERKPLSELKKESKKPKHKSSALGHKVVAQGMYLDDLESVDKDVANLYLQQAGHREPMLESTKGDSNYSKIDIDPIKSDSELNKSDGESGLGSSLPVSPDEANLIECEPYSDIAMSLCGNLRKGKVSLERFMELMISFEDFATDPSQILSNPKLVVRIGERYYNWSVAVPMLMSHVVYQRPLPQASVDALMKVHMPKKAKRRGYSSWFSSWRSQPEHNESTDEDCQDGERERWTSERMEATEREKAEGISSEPLQEILETSVEIEMDLSATDIETYKKVLELSSEQLESLNLKDGANEVTFSVTTKYQGTASCTASIFLYNYNDKIIISDIDGTITKSDVLGHILPASFWAQLGVTKLFSTIQENGYKFMYLSARAIGQAEITRQHLKNVVQENLGLPSGPIFLSPSSLIKAFHRELIEKKPEEFKIQCLRNIRKLFPLKSEPFFAGFGNKMSDVLSYRAVGIPVQRIFTVNHKGEVKNELTNAFQSSYPEMQDLIDQMFPPFIGSTSLVASDEYSTFTFWRTPVAKLDDDEPLAKVSSTLVSDTTS